VQQFEKSFLDRPSRSRSQTTAKVAADKEDDSEKDIKGTGSEDEDEDEAPKRRPVSPMSSFVVSRPFMICETRPDQCKEKYYGFFTRSI
jgi:hypothetical protein